MADVALIVAGVVLVAVGAGLFYAHLGGFFDWALGEFMMKIGVGVLLLGPLLVRATRNLAAR